MSPYREQCERMKPACMECGTSAGLGYDAMWDVYICNCGEWVETYERLDDTEASK